MREYNKGILALVVSAFFSGFAGVLLKLIYASGVSVISVLFLSVFLGTVCVLLFNFKHIDFKPKKELWKWIFLLSFFGNLTGIFVSFAYKFTSVADAVLLHYTMPLFAFLVAIFFLKEKITKWKVFALVLSIVGVFFVFGQGLFSTGLVNLGNLLALCSAVTYALIVVISRKLDKVSKFTIYFWNFLFSSIVLSFFLPFGFSIPTLSQLPLLLVYIVFINYVFLILFYYGTGKVESSRSSIIMLLEAVISVFAAYIILHEPLGVIQVFGGFLILVGSVVLILRK
jgi:drug/metabolite transporter (DMT)-like permease